MAYDPFRLRDPFTLDNPFDNQFQMFGGLGSSSPRLARPRPGPAFPALPEDEEEAWYERMGGKLLSGLGWLGETLDKSFGGRTVRGLLGGQGVGSFAHLIPLSDTFGLTESRGPESPALLADKADVPWGRDLLEQWGALDPNTEGIDWGDVAGFGLDVALDPVSYLAPGALTGAGRLARKMGVKLPGWKRSIQGGTHTESNVARQLAAINKGLPEAEHLIPEAIVPAGSYLLPTVLEKAAKKAGMDLLPETTLRLKQAARMPVPQPAPLAPVVGSVTGSLDEALRILGQGNIPPASVYTKPIAPDLYARLQLKTPPGQAASPLTPPTAKYTMQSLVPKAAASPATPLRGLVGIDPLPLGLNRLFGIDPWTVGFGPKSQAIAGAFDTIGSALNKSLPVRYLKSLLNPSSGRSLSVEGQQTWEGFGHPLLKERQIEARAETQARRQAIEPTIEKAGALEPELHRMYIQSGEGSLELPRTYGQFEKDLKLRDPRRWDELNQSGELGNLKREWARIRKTGEEIGESNRIMFGSEKEAAIKINDAADLAEYMVRIKAAEPIGTGAGFWKRMTQRVRNHFNTSHASQLARKSEYRMVPGGQPQLDDLAMNPMVSGPNRLLNDMQVEDFLMRELAHGPGEGSLYYAKQAAGNPPRPLPGGAASARQVAKSKRLPMDVPTHRKLIQSTAKVAVPQPPITGQLIPRAADFDEAMDILNRGDIPPTGIYRKAMTPAERNWYVPGVTDPLHGAARLFVEPGSYGPTARLEIQALKRPMTDIQKQAHNLAASLKKLPPEHAAQKLPLFEQDVVASAYLRAQRSLEARTASDAIFEGIKRFARPVSEFAPDEKYVNVLDVINGVGLDPALAHVKAVQKVRQKFPFQKLGPLQDYAIPQSFYNDMVKWSSSFQPGPELGGMLRAYDYGLQLFKDLVTLPFPAKHFRDLSSGVYQMWRGDALGLQGFDDAAAAVRGKAVTTSGQAIQPWPGMRTAPGEASMKAMVDEAVAGNIAFVQSARSSSESLLNPGARKRIAEELPGKLDDQNLGQQLVGWGKKFVKQDKQTGKYSSDIIENLRRVGNTNNDFVRFAHYSNLRRKGFTPEAARIEVMKYHFDWDDLTPFDRNVMRRIIPFWSWSKKNLPSIVTDMATKPGKLAATFRGINQGRQEAGYAPSFIGEGMSIPMAGDEPGITRFLTGFGLPVEDEFLSAGISAATLNPSRATQQLLGQTNPLLKGIIEAGTGKQLHTGRELIDLPPGELARGFGALSDEYAKPLSQFISNTPAARAATTVDKLSRENANVPNALLQLMTGFRTTDVDTEQALRQASRKLIEQQMRQQGKVRQFSRVFVPEDQVPEILADPQAAQTMQMYNTLLERAREAGLEKKAAAGDQDAARQLRLLRKRQEKRNR